MISDGATRAKILSVGQSGREYRSLLDCFKGPQWCVSYASGVRAFREAVASGPVDVLITEMTLPDGGWEELLNHSGFGQEAPPVIVSTDTPDSSIWAEALSHGAYDVLAKPFSAEEVLYVVRNAWLLRQRRTGSAAAAGVTAGSGHFSPHPKDL